MLSIWTYENSQKYGNTKNHINTLLISYTESKAFTFNRNMFPTNDTEIQDSCRIA